MVYNVIGLMSGSSLDGLDIAFVEITDIRNEWTFEIKNTDCIPFDETLQHSLGNASALSVPEFLKLHTFFGRWMGTQVNAFIDKNNLQHKVHFIASHGHTVFHDPENNTSTQIGDGASLSAITGLPCITDLRNMDVALGGQGAPIVPIADKMFFKKYQFCLNLGGIANVTINGDAPIAFDICPANQLLNHYANALGQKYDEQGLLAQSGAISETLLAQLNCLDFYKISYPKSLNNTFSKTHITFATESSFNFIDILATFTAHIAIQIREALKPYAEDGAEKQMLVTGGGAFNSFLVAQIQESVAPLGITIVIPEADLVNHKEALAMALIGVLRWREDENVLASVTGASKNSVGGALWLGN